MYWGAFGVLLVHRGALSDLGPNRFRSFGALWRTPKGAPRSAKSPHRHHIEPLKGPRDYPGPQRTQSIQPNHLMVSAPFVHQASDYWVTLTPSSCT